MKFYELINEITKLGYDYHKETILENSKRNAPYITKTIRELKDTEKRRCLVISAGPSLYRQRTLQRINPEGICIVAIDGSYIQCLKAGIVPDYVVTLDPHPTRMVRWFGDPDFENNLNGDDYFARQDLDVDFRKNSLSENEANIRLVDEHKAPLIICSTAPANVVKRTQAFNRYWFAPLIDAPQSSGLTDDLTAITGLPALNTGGTVGTAAWNFAHSVLGCKDIAVVGMDLGYSMDTPFNMTQTWPQLKDLKPIYEFFPHFTTPYGEYYTDPTYWWYRENLLDLLEANECQLTNCSEAGMLFGERIKNVSLETWLASSKPTVSSAENNSSLSNTGLSVPNISATGIDG